MTGPFNARTRWPRVAAALVGCAALAGCAVTLDQDEALTVIPYSVRPEGRMLIDVGLNGQGPFRFMLDTAATGSFLLPGPRDAIGLEPLPGVTASVYGAVASGSFAVVQTDSLTVGDVVWADAQLVALPAGTIATVGIDGILGVDFLRRYSVGFDVRNRALRLYRPETLAERNYAGWSSIPLDTQRFGNAVEPLHFFEIEIAGYRLPALFDLGAGVSLLNKAGAVALQLAPTNRAEAVEFAGALGSGPLIARLGQQDLETAGVRWHNESFLIADPEIFATLGYADRPLAILGSGLFNQRDFVIDFARNRLLIRASMREIETNETIPADALNGSAPAEP